ncbi:hypothetical protein [Streptomyces sp. NPDC002685]|uniref:hypothetical protein n=1 Tax=Streptomyces sp. NPDC002685 TaxID=3154540 RepID=UPI0033335861
MPGSSKCFGAAVDGPCSGDGTNRPNFGAVAAATLTYGFAALAMLLAAGPPVALVAGRVRQEQA